MSRQDDILDILDRVEEVNSSEKEDSTNWYVKNGSTTKFLHYVLGRYMLEHCHIKRIDGEIYIYDKDTRSLR